MQAKIAITTKCGARCKTCPAWKMPETTLPVDDFVTVWDKLNSSHMVSSIFVNSTGDFFSLEDYIWYADYIENYSKKRVAITTNGLNLEYIPRVREFIISFNGCDKESYEYTTGNNFEKVVGNIRDAYDSLKKRVKTTELHCLVWEGNPDPEEKLLELFGDFPGKIRLSYKYDNQFGPDYTIESYRSCERVPCDYLDKLVIYPTGDVIMCSHDHEGNVQWGNLIHDSISDCFHNIERVEKRFLHKGGFYTGLCEKCNYNTRGKGRIVYLK